MQGWIKLHRQIWECWIWTGEGSFDRRSAWVDLLLMANHADAKVMFDGVPVVVPAGSFITSERKLANRWKWGRRAVGTFLNALEVGECIVAKRGHRCTTVTIVNWDKYQVDGATDAPVPSQSRTSPAPVPHTNKNDKNDKNDKNEEKAIHPPMNPPSGDVAEKKPKRQSSLSAVQEERFNRFWSAYPRKEKKGTAEKAWAKINPDEAETQEILEGVARAVRLDHRFKDRQYTPHPASWLTGREWTNEYDERKAQNVGKASDKQYDGAGFRRKV